MKRRIIGITVVILIVISTFASFFMMLKNESSSDTAILTDSSAQSADSSEETAVKQAASTYLKNLKLGNIEEAYSVVADDAEDGMDVLNKQKEFAKTIEDYENDTIKEENAEYFAFTVASAVREYAITSVEVSGDAATVSADLDSVDSSKIEQVTEEDLQAFNEQLLEDEADTLNEIYYNEGEEAMQEYVLQKQAEYMYSQMKKNTQAVDSVTVVLQLTLNKNSDGEWKITKIVTGDAE